MKTSELIGTALDWAVAKCENKDWSDEDCLVHVTTFDDFDGTICNYSTDWEQAGPIIEREEIELHKWALDGWEAHATNYSFLNTPNEKPEFAKQHGPTPLIAAMRCYVASVLGDEVEIPATLLETV